jgi:hypothetical protein
MRPQDARERRAPPQASRAVFPIPGLRRSVGGLRGSPFACKGFAMSPARRRRPAGRGARAVIDERAEIG